MSDLLDMPVHIYAQYSPSLVFSSSKETKEDFLKRRKKYYALPEMIREKMGFATDRIIEIGKLFKLEPEQAAWISRSVRSFYFNELKTEAFQEIFSREMKVDPETARKIALFVMKKVIEDDTVEKEYAKNRENLPIVDALKKYPQLGNQEITSSPITIKRFPSAVHPSIRNWLASYAYESDYKSHNSAERSIFLYQSENTRHLSEEDRFRLSYILKSFDEKMPVEINKKDFTVVFPRIPEKAIAEKNNPDMKNGTSLEKVLQSLEQLPKKNFPDQPSDRSTDISPKKQIIFDDKMKAPSMAPPAPPKTLDYYSISGRPIIDSGKERIPLGETKARQEIFPSQPASEKKLDLGLSSATDPKPLSRQPDFGAKNSASGNYGISKPVTSSDESPRSHNVPRKGLEKSLANFYEKKQEQDARREAGGNGFGGNRVTQALHRLKDKADLGTNTFSELFLSGPKNNYLSPSENPFLQNQVKSSGTSNGDLSSVAPENRDLAREARFIVKKTLAPKPDVSGKVSYSSPHQMPHEKGPDEKDDQPPQPSPKKKFHQHHFHPKKKFRHV